MSSQWPAPSATDGDASSEAPDAAKVVPLPPGPVDVADTGVPDIGGLEAARVAPAAPPNRPPLQRNQLQPGAPSAPGNPPEDSLSLAQLRRLVSEFPRSEATAYDFEYTDTASHAEEIDEWFAYQFHQWVRLSAAQRAWEWHWEQWTAARSEDVAWDGADEDFKSRFLSESIQGLKSDDSAVHTAAVGRLVYLVLGRWAEGAGPMPAWNPNARCVATDGHLAAIKAGVQTLSEMGGIPAVWASLRSTFENLWAEDFQRPRGFDVAEAQNLLLNLLTIIYMCVQVVLGDGEGMEPVRQELLDLDPDIVSFMLTAASKLRWQDANVVPVTQTLLLFWKTILLVFGGTSEIEETKEALKEVSALERDKNKITASPLDYHVFRQEITSKYPSYVPPQPAIPLEAENTSILPPLPHHPTRNNGSNGIIPAPPGAQNGGASILHQPVHIATPAPSPPPSPAVGGKGGKKQNYQTNQNFPFMYPPLDATSNSAGGKGGAGLQDVLVGRRWEGSDVPASILEAGELFSTRVRMTRATRQLWEERERFLKFDRGWDASDDVDDLDLDSLALDEDIDDDKLLEAIEKRQRKAQGVEIDYGSNPDIDIKFKRRLEDLEKFYDLALPQLQSLVIVLMKGVLLNVTACIALPSNGQHPGMTGAVNNGRANGGPALNRSHENGGGQSSLDPNDGSAEDLDATRSREIESKAATGIMLLLLKWLKISHVLKFEYLTQLLLDSNYLPLVLKLFAHQDIQSVVDSKTDRLEHSFFYFCNHKAYPADRIMTEPTEIDGPEEESEDEAAPPPIRLRPTVAETAPAPAQQVDEPAEASEEQEPSRPEVDELGYPVNALPKEPITNFSRRNFFALINYLRIMQKICKNKAHRNLLLVQYKSSNIIRKSLKIPQQELRLYTLKLFKNQVPYCGRKWRQGNMRVITAVYLHCRPELRDEWLAGSDVDAEVEEALPLEQALRSLTHWFNVRRHPGQMAPEVREALQSEQDFFKRELDKLDIWGEPGAGETAAGDWDHMGQAFAWG